MAKDVIMPVLGMNQDTAVLLAWLKSEGDRVQEGEPIMEVETDKATMELDAPASGTLVNVSAQAGEEVRVGSTIAVIVAEGEVVPAGVTASSPEGEAAPGAEPATAGSGPGPSLAAPRAASEEGSHGDGAAPAPLDAPRPPVATPTSAASVPDGQGAQAGLVPASPKARRLAGETGVSLGPLRGLGSGPEGAVLAADVLRAVAEGGPAEGTAAEPETAASAPVALGGAAAPLTLERQVDASELRAMLAWARERGSAEVTLGDLLARFTAAVWNRYPLAGAAPTSALAYHRPLAGGDGAGRRIAYVPDAHRASLQAIASARLGAGEPPDGEADASQVQAALALVDLSGSRLDRCSGSVAGALVTVVAGRLQQRVIAVEGAAAVRETLALTLAFDAGRVALDDAAAWAERLVGLIETPSDLLILY